MKKLKENSGITLLEMIIVIAIMGIVGAVVFSLFFSGQNIFGISSKEAANQGELRVVSTYVANELKTVKKLSDSPIVGESHSAFEFDENNLDLVEYAADGSEISRKTTSSELSGFKLTSVGNSSVEINLVTDGEDPLDKTFSFSLENANHNDAVIASFESASKIYFTKFE